jgi:RNA 2',3'-cyclic 3'-phosphodiesterase
MRCFVAIALPAAVRKHLVRVQDILRRSDPDVKWVEEENLHLSLKFLGDVDEEPLARLKGLLSIEALRWPKIRLTYAGIGTFPEHGTPRVLWAGCSGDLERLAGLAGAVERAAEVVGVPREHRPFVAHLTIGRVRSARNVKRLKASLENQREVPLGSDDVGAFVLFKSTVTNKGPIYEELSAFPLQA